MGTAMTPRILLCADSPQAVEEVRPLLEQAGFGVRCHLLGGADPDDVAAYSLVLLDGHQGNGEALRLCRRLRGRLADRFLPLLYVTADPSPAARLASLENGADTYLLWPFAPGELLAQVQVFLRIKEGHDRLAETSAEVNRINKRLQQAYQQIDQELDL